MNKHEIPQTKENPIEAYVEMKARWYKKIDEVFTDERIKYAYLNRLNVPLFNGETIIFEEIQLLIAALTSARFKRTGSASEVRVMEEVILEIASDLEKFSETYFPGQVVAVAEKKRVEQINYAFRRKKEEWEGLVNDVFGNDELKFELLHLLDKYPKDIKAGITKEDILDLMEIVKYKKLEEHEGLQRFSGTKQNDVKVLVETILEELELFSKKFEK